MVLFIVGSVTLQQIEYHPLTALKFNLTGPKDDLRVGDKFTIVVMPTPSNTTERDWTVTASPTGFVSVTKTNPNLSPDGWDLEGIAEPPNPVNITVQRGNLNATYVISKVASKPIAVTSVTLDKTQGSGLRVGDKFTLTATVQPPDATNKDTYWTAADPTVLKVTPRGTLGGNIADVEVLLAGSGTTIQVGGTEGTKATYTSGQILPAPVMPPDIDLTTAALDGSLIYLGGEVPYLAADGVLKWSSPDEWPLQYVDGAAVGRILPEAANINRITKAHFEGANQTNQQGTDTWRYTSGANPTAGPGNAIDGDYAVGYPLWFNASRVMQDGAIVKDKTSAYDAFYQVAKQNNLMWMRCVLHFTITSAAATETRMDAILDPSGTGSNFMAYSYKESEPGNYTFSVFRRRNTNNDKWVYSLPQITKGGGAPGPFKGSSSQLARVAVPVNDDITIVRVHFADNTTRDYANPPGHTTMTIGGDPNDNWFQKIATTISFHRV